MMLLLYFVGVLARHTVWVLYRMWYIQEYKYIENLIFRKEYIVEKSMFTSITFFFFLRIKILMNIDKLFLKFD